MASGSLQKRLHPHVNLLMREDSVVLRFKGEFFVIPQNDDALVDCVKLWKSGCTEDEFRTAIEQSPLSCSASEWGTSSWLTKTVWNCRT
jgi:hypothetical protein